MDLHSRKSTPDLLLATRYPVRLGSPKLLDFESEGPVYVCICHAVTRDEFDDVVARGAMTVDAVGESCGAGTGCGSCRERLSCLLSATRQQHTVSRALETVPA
ncbi:MAG TPA: (2Fe-2S)-binding protein [Actinomycetes bacterium]|nr:(2Fe-2S)-binding protein [Actinomycetes bacterium]